MPPRAPAPAPSPFTKDHLRDTFIFLLVLILIGALINQFRLSYAGLSSEAFASLWSEFLAWLYRFWSVWKVIAAILIGLCLWWAAYNKIKHHNIEKAEKQVYGVEPGTILPQSVEKLEEKENPKWTGVLAHMNSINPSDWRLAIIEADIMLDELLTANGYHGESIGDKLKAVEPSDMLSLDAAWEAHKVRNRIAHSGTDFELNERETKRVIALFERVFKEYKII